MSIITLTTDFGEADHYIACMKGVILQHAPSARIVDVTHLIQPHHVVHGAFVLWQIIDYFPEGTIHIAVVDPGVGTARRLVAARYNDQTFLAPDNGLLSLVHRDHALQQLRAIENTRLFRTEVSATFHGRDILAPVAAHLAEGTPFEDLGPIIDRLDILDLGRATSLPNGGLEGRVLYVDRFGNLISNISQADLQAAATDHGLALPGPKSPRATEPAGVKPVRASEPAGVKPVRTSEPDGVNPVRTSEPACVNPVRTSEPDGVKPVRTSEPACVKPVPPQEGAFPRVEGLRLEVRVGARLIGPLRSTYADVAEGQIIALIGSTGMLEVAVNQGSAADHLHAGPGTPILFR